MATFLHRAIAYGDRPEPEPAVVVLGALPAEATVAASARQIQVSWPATEVLAGPAVAAYEVQWRSGSQGWDELRRRVVTGLSYAIDGLFDGTLYTVRVRPAARLPPFGSRATFTTQHELDHIIGIPHYSMAAWPET